VELGRRLFDEVVGAMAGQLREIAGFDFRD